MKLRVEVDRVVASITLDSAWTPELLSTLLRQCGDEVARLCGVIGGDDETDIASDVIVDDPDDT